MMEDVTARVAALIDIEDRVSAIAASPAADGVTVGEFVDTFVPTLTTAELQAIAEAYLLDFITSGDAEDDEAEPDELERSSVKVRDVLTIGALKSPVMFGMEQ